MAPEDVKKLLIIVSSFLIFFLAFFFLFWRPKSSDLSRYQRELSDKAAELAQLERDAKDWPDTITREALERYEGELGRLLELIPSEEEIAMLLDEIQTHARVANLEILSLSRIPDARSRPQSSRVKASAEKEPEYVRVSYEISLGGNYFGLTRFLRRLEESRRLVTVEGIKMLAGRGSHPVDAQIQFDIFYSKMGVEVG